MLNPINVFLSKSIMQIECTVHICEGACYTYTISTRSDIEKSFVNQIFLIQCIYEYTMAPTTQYRLRQIAKYYLFESTNQMYV